MGQSTIATGCGVSGPQGTRASAKNTLRARGERKRRRHIIILPLLRPGNVTIPRGPGPRLLSSCQNHARIDQSTRGPTDSNTILEDGGMSVGMTGPWYFSLGIVHAVTFITLLVTLTKLLKGRCSCIFGVIYLWFKRVPMNSRSRTIRDNSLLNLRL